MISSETTLGSLESLLEHHGVTISSIRKYPRGWWVEMRSKHGDFEVVAGQTMTSAVRDCLKKALKISDRPIDELIERSSLGTPEAKALRASASKEAVDAVLKKSHTYENPAVHWRSGGTSSCGLVRAGGDHARFASSLEEVTCGRCKHSARYRSDLMEQRRRRS